MLGRRSVIRSYTLFFFPVHVVYAWGAVRDWASKTFVLVYGKAMSLALTAVAIEYRMHTYIVFSVERFRFVTDNPGLTQPSWFTCLCRSVVYCLILHVRGGQVYSDPKARLWWGDQICLPMSS